MPDKSFASNLRTRLESKPTLKVKERRLLNALRDDTPGPLRRRQMALAEEHAKSLMGFAPTQKVDWSDVGETDWSALLAKMIEFLLKLFALFA